MNSQFHKHLEVLRDGIFQTRTKWPQFNLLLDDLEELAAESNPESEVLALERTLMYGGYSLVGPIFGESKFTSIDVSPSSADQRGAYNEHLINDPDFIRVLHNYRVTIESLELEAGAYDLIIVPNLVHHVADQVKLFSDVARALKPNGKVYVFEALTRELHQEPDDFLRYTPYGLEEAMRTQGLEVIESRREGGVFQTLSYLYQQALEYVPADRRQEFKTSMLMAGDLRDLCELDKQFPTNLVRVNSSYPTAFSVIAKK